ncbi:TPR repeat containing protein [Beggiatoa sp. PS]|nr:TPR repeat containing protein [Beggiatoa sp. PS]
MMKKTLIFLFILLIAPFYGYASDIEQANLAFEQGKFEESVQNWQVILSQTQKGTTQQVEAQLKLAMSYHALGFHDKALHILLKKATPIAKSLKETVLLIQIKMALSDVYLTLHQRKEAKEFLNTAEDMAKKMGKLQLLASIFNKRGNLLMMSTQIDEAMLMYQKSLELAKKYSENLLIAKVMLNQTLAIPVRSDIDDTSAIDELENTLNVIQTLPASHFKSFGLIALSQIPKHLEEEAFEFDDIQREKSQNMVFQTLKAAQESAKQTGDDRALSYALGFLGQLYEQAYQDDQVQRYKNDAILLTRQAIFYAQQTGNVTSIVPKNACNTSQQAPTPMPEITYRWYWQLARLLTVQKNQDEAIKQYQLAVNHFTSVRSRLRDTGYRYTPYQFEEKFAPLYLEFIELLFQKVKDGKNQQSDLQKVRDAIELLKEDEIKDYFQLDCIGKSEQSVKKLPPHTAVFYLLFLKQELKLLLNLPNGLKLIDVPISVSKIKAQAKDFRGNIINKENQENLLEESTQLYNSLIKPIEAKLTEHQIKTLIIVPDGVLRTIPFAALHDGKQFLIDKKYALVIAQGMDLINTQAPDWEPSKILLNGVSEAVQGFDPLPNVKEELKNIQAIYPHTHSKFLDNLFTESTFKKQLLKKAYNIVHIASHASFKDKPEQTFLLTHDGKVSLDQLEKFIKSKNADLPLELITLSACDTAKGGDKAALGLAGITLKAGAKSALASLWQVDDKSTAELGAEFYRQLKLNQGITKAQALQKAQLKVIKMKEYQHPYYWAAFILIGNWL